MKKAWQKKTPEKSTLKKEGFYQSRTWRRARRLALQRDRYLCQRCLRKKTLTKATEVHHIKPLEEYPELGLELSNLQSLCWRCHEETKRRESRAQETPSGVRVIRVTGAGDETAGA